MAGIAGCCARAASGEAIGAPPGSVRNSRRSMGPVEIMRCVSPNYSRLELPSEWQNWHRQMPTVLAGPISVAGQSRYFGDVRVTSALPLKADIHRKGRHVSKVPITDMGRHPI
jgi:hypothetical protein